VQADLVRWHHITGLHVPHIADDDEDEEEQEDTSSKAVEFRERVPSAEHSQ